MASNEEPKQQFISEHVEQAVHAKGVASGHAEGNALLVDKQGKIRKLPVPSSDPNDPLNFTGWEKWSVIFCCCWFSLCSLSLVSGLGAFLGVLFGIYAPEGYSPSQISLLLTLASLCIGLGNFIVLPVALAFGRRPVFLASTIVLLASTIGAGAPNSYSGHLACRVIQGLATGASESLLPLMLTEVTFLHERGRILGLYWAFQNISSAALNLAASYQVAAIGWRWYYWIFAIIVAAGVVFVFFGAFETGFQRPAVNIDGQIVITDEYGRTQVVPDSEAQEVLARLGTQVEQADAGVVAPKMPYIQRIKPWSKPHSHPWQTIATSWLRMAEALTSPAILYVILLTSLALATVIFVSLTYDSVLQEYGWQPKSVGLINLGSLVASFIALGYCTLIGEPLMLLLARRNHGVHKPEHRLLLLIAPCCLGFAMILTYGWTTTGATAWGPVLSYSFFVATFISLLIISSTFAAEATPKHPGPAMVMIIGTKNLVSFGTTYGLSATIGVRSYKWSFGLLAGLYAGVALLGITVYLFNPVWRRYRTRVEEKAGVTSSD